MPIVEGGWSGWAYMNAPKPKADFDESIDFWSPKSKKQRPNDKLGGCGVCQRPR
jgi:hypothetical protein